MKPRIEGFNDTKIAQFDSHYERFNGQKTYEIVKFWLGSYEKAAATRTSQF